MSWPAGDQQLKVHLVLSIAGVEIRFGPEEP